MDLASFCRELPKVELHAHLSGSLSSTTLSKLMKLANDSGCSSDELMNNKCMEAFSNDCWEVFRFFHSVVIDPAALALATRLTLQEFQDDGCCYIELRSTPRETPYMSRRLYIETIIDTIMKESQHLSIIAKYIISVDRKQPMEVINDVTNLAIEYHNKHPNIVVGLELSGTPAASEFHILKPVFVRARDNGLKLSLHCGEIKNIKEIAQMLHFHPERIGHGTCILPRLGGNEEIWNMLVESKIPVEIAMTSNVKCKTVSDYASHHFKEMFDADVPVIICTDDKGAFKTSLSEEYKVCGETFSLTRSQLARLALNACQYVFAEDCKKLLSDKVLNFIDKHAL